MNTSNILKTRFAPSPTGLMHFGNIRTALFNYLFSLKNKGKLLIRVEDSDEARSTDAFCESLLNDIRWLNINWQEGPFKQSERKAVYEEYYNKLIDLKLVYPCFCSEAALSIARKSQLSSKQPPRYSGLCRNLSALEIKTKIEAGLKPTLRFTIPKGVSIKFDDLIKGEQNFAANDLGDFIIRRQDGSASFMFCNAIDDALMNVTHALRGDDHLTNTPRQLLILQALKLPLPQYGHFPMITGPDGCKLSKRNGSRSIEDLRVAGYQPQAILNYLAGLGHYYKKPYLRTIEQLAEEFSVQHIASSPARFDVQQLDFWQKEVMQSLSLDEFAKLVNSFLNKVMSAELKNNFLNWIKPNIVMPNDIKHWVNVTFSDDIDYCEEANAAIRQAPKDFFHKILTYLAENIHIDYKKLITYLQSENYKGKVLFLPLRAALTGRLAGPELVGLLPLMSLIQLKIRFEKAEAISKC